MQRDIRMVFKMADELMEQKKFTTLAEARSYAWGVLGNESPEIGLGCVVSTVGTGSLYVSGVSWSALFPKLRREMMLLRVRLFCVGVKIKASRFFKK